MKLLLVNLSAVVLKSDCPSSSDSMPLLPGPPLWYWELEAYCLPAFPLKVVLVLLTCRLSLEVFLNPVCRLLPELVA